MHLGKYCCFASQERRICSIMCRKSQSGTWEHIEGGTQVKLLSTSLTSRYRATNSALAAYIYSVYLYTTTLTGTQQYVTDQLGIELDSWMT